MYYKIVNKDSEVYKNLYNMRMNEILWEKENKQILKKLLGDNWTGDYLGYGGQQTFLRISEYYGFVFSNPSEVDPKIWRQHPERENLFVINKRTKKGKEFKISLNRSLHNGHWFSIIYDYLDIPDPSGTFTLPVVNVCNDIIALFLDHKHIPNNADVIEITSEEFKKLNADGLEFEKHTYFPSSDAPSVKKDN